MKNLLTVILIMTTLKLMAVAPPTVEATADDIVKKGAARTAAEAGVRHAAKLWQATDGDDAAFRAFCIDNFVAGAEERERLMLRISGYLEGINGHYNEMLLGLRCNLDLDTGPLMPVDELFGSYSPSSHLTDDLYANKIAFVVALNFPEMTLEEKEKLGGDRLGWAYARMGDLFTSRVPAAVQQAESAALSAAEVYIASYNIHMGCLRDQAGKQLFPDGMVLLSHWNLRDEIKANYNKGAEGLAKQRMIVTVMDRIIAQQIPVQAIDSDRYQWQPYANTLTEDGKKVDGQPEGTVRYQKLLDIFRASQQVDPYTGDTYIGRSFDRGMEISVAQAEQLFDSYLRSPELRQVGQLIAQRLGRKLESFDIWYDGFKQRSNLDDNALSVTTRKLYPTPAAFGAAMPSLLEKLGFTAGRAEQIASHIVVDPARGSGHAWQAEMKGDRAHLRTRIGADGMDYKGYNIAVHEFGHNVEQTISLYDVDYYMLRGTPNTAFTEALAFVFQQRDLALLGIAQEDTALARRMDLMDKAWSLMEICGVSMVDIGVWKWLYAHPDATAAELRDETMAIARGVWNRYFAPVYGVRDEPLLAVYSHMIEFPLYLSNYAYGQIIEFQLESYLRTHDFATEVDRMYRLGRLTPRQWMMQATGTPLSAESLLEALRGELAGR